MIFERTLSDADHRPVVTVQGPVPRLRFSANLQHRLQRPAMQRLRVNPRPKTYLHDQATGVWCPSSSTTTCLIRTVWLLSRVPNTGKCRHLPLTGAQCRVRMRSPAQTNLATISPRP